MNIITDIIEKIITLTNSLEDKIQEGVGLTGWWIAQGCHRTISADSSWQRT